MLTDLPDFKEIRKDFPALNKWHYFDTAATGLMPKRAMRSMRKWLKDQLLNGDLSYNSWLKETERVRDKIAKLINASPQEIAFTKNTSEGLSIVANGLKFRKDENVILNDLEFPANVYPWLNRARVKFVKSENGRITIEDIEKAVDERTRAVAISSVQFSTGFRIELERLGKLCKEKGIYLVVDGIQSVGALRMDVKRCDVDFLACGSYKWLMAPPGVGFLYVSEKVMEELEVSEVGWMSVKEPFNYYDYRLEFEESARRFECGNPPFPLIYGLGATLDLIDELGINNIEKRILGLNGLLIEGLRKLGVKVLSPLEGEHRSGIVLFDVRDRERIFKALRRNDVIVSLRRGIRVSTHFYNDESDVEKLVKVVRQSIR
jgi:selenocysteine lyase/cysteine desulfurase